MVLEYSIIVYFKASPGGEKFYFEGLFVARWFCLICGYANVWAMYDVVMVG